MANKKDRHLIIGAGEVGTAVFNVLRKHYPTFIRDKEDGLEGRFEVLHIAYPPAKGFVQTTKKHAEKYKPRLVIIHSTVPVGTTKKIGTMAVHSPIRGMHSKSHHPGTNHMGKQSKVRGDSVYFAKTIKNFVKYFGGPKAEIAAAYFSEIGVPTRCFNKSETTELAKILDTTYYGWNVIFAKEVKRICDKHSLDFDEVYTIPNQHYNQGYKKHGLRHVVRPVLKHIPGGIGGHCVVPNAYLLDDWLTKTLRERNEIYKRRSKTA